MLDEWQMGLLKKIVSAIYCPEMNDLSVNPLLVKEVERHDDIIRQVSTNAGMLRSSQSMTMIVLAWIDKNPESTLWYWPPLKKRKPRKPRKPKEPAFPIQQRIDDDARHAERGGGRY